MIGTIQQRQIPAAVIREQARIQRDFRKGEKILRKDEKTKNSIKTKASINTTNNK